MLPEDEKLVFCGAEIEVLKGVIDYAERMIYQEGQSQYGTLRRHAYGKTVVIDTEKKGRLVFRLSSTGVVYPNSASGYASPHSPVGRLCSFLRYNDEDESPAWGEYRVKEIRLFDRFDGLQFEENVRNFLRMSVEGDSGDDTVTDLLRTLRRGAAEKPKPLLVKAIVELPPVVDEEPEQQPDVPVVSEVVAEKHAIPLAHLDLEEDDQDMATAEIDLDESEDLKEADQPSGEEYFGLSEVFYINRTREQDQVISRSPVGPMFVEGVAGSGKTSAALGRTKMLCDFNEAAVSDEGAFREIAGRSLDYWSGKYAGKFTQEGSIGFVRTGELIQYLKETCRRIDLPNLPVAEFKELQVRLREHRKIEHSRLPGGRWKLNTTSRGTDVDTSMAWLVAADRSVAKILIARLSAGALSKEQLAVVFAENIRGKVLPVADVAITHFLVALKPIVTVLGQSSAIGRFGLDRIAENLASAMRETRIRILGKDVLWFVAGDEAIYAANEHAMAVMLMRRKVALYTRNSARLVFTNGDGPVDETLQFMTLEGQCVDWNAETNTLLADGKLAVIGQDGQAFPALMSDLEGLYLRLLPESIDKAYILRAGKLRALALQKGLGKAKFAAEKRIEDPSEDDLEDSDGEDAGADELNPLQKETDARVTTIDAVFRRTIQKLLLQPLAYVADAYAESLTADSRSYPDPALAKKIARQLEGKSLTEEDIDIVLCLAHIMGRKFSGNPAALREPSFHQSVFIDEVQDFTEQQIFLMAEQARPDYRAVTVVGDIAQKLHHGSSIDIKACFPGLEVAHVRLSENLRQLSAPGLAWFSACFRAEFQDRLTGKVPTGMLLQKLSVTLDDVKGPELVRYASESEMDVAIVTLLKKVPRGQTAAVILPSRDAAIKVHDRLRSALASSFIETELSDKVDLSRRHMRHFTSVMNAKGLEFDVVILPMLESYDFDDRSHINRLYVGLTRARRQLVMLGSTHPASSRMDDVWASYEGSIAELLAESL